MNNEFNLIDNIKTYIQRDYLVLEFESDSGKYTRNYSLEQLHNLDNYFKQFEELEEVLNDLRDLFKDPHSIEQNEEYFRIIITYRKRQIIFELNKVIENVNLSYDFLSDKMKDIINKNEIILGIDLGTTYSCAAVMIDNNIVMIRNSLGSTTTPSYISFMARNEVYVGELAKLLPSTEKNIIFNTKRLLGKTLEDEDIKEIMKKLPFRLKKDKNFNLLLIELNFDDTSKNVISLNTEEYFYPEQMSALILKKIVKDSEFYLSNKIGRDIKINRAVITVPAYFNQKQRESTLNSANIIGLKVETLINEPTAASLAYAYQSLKNEDKQIIVIDFGGGTLDITLLRYKRDKEGIYCDVKFTYGNTKFGGEDFDNILIEKCKEKIKGLNEKNESKILNDNYENNMAHLLRLKSR